MVFEQVIRHSLRRRALHSIAEGFNPTARNADRIYFAISISLQSPHAGGDARAPRTHVVQSFCLSLSAVRTPEPCRGFPALREGFSPHAQRRARAGGLRLACDTAGRTKARAWQSHWQAKALPSPAGFCSCGGRRFTARSGSCRSSAAPDRDPGDRGSSAQHRRAVRRRATPPALCSAPDPERRSDTWAPG